MTDPGKGEGQDEEIEPEEPEDEQVENDPPPENSWSPSGIVTADIYRGENITPGPTDYTGSGRRKRFRGLR